MPTTNLKAHELYVRGRLEWNQRTTESLQRAIGLFQQAIDADAKFALAHVGLADSYFLLSEYGSLAHKEGFAKARTAVEAALKLDGELAEAHTTLAGISANEWNWPAAQAGFQRALQLRPNYATAHHWYSHLLSVLGRLDESLAMARRARELDPEAPMIGVNVAIVLLRANQTEEAIKHLEGMLARHRDFVWVHHVLASAYLRAGRTPEALQESANARQLAETSATLSTACHVYASAGKMEEAQQFFQRLQERAARQHVPFFDLAAVHAALGDHEKALTLLEKAEAERESRLLDLKFDVALMRLHQAPRFRAILERMRLQP
jgi:tetratricopeptide (TPR) repeat protein